MLIQGNLLLNPVKFVDVYALYLSLTHMLIISGVYDNLGIEPQIERIGKYKRAGDKLIRKTMSEDHREMLTALLDNISSNWLDKVSSASGEFAFDVVIVF
jgi:protease-4